MTTIYIKPKLFLQNSSRYYFLRDISCCLCDFSTISQEYTVINAFSNKKFENMKEDKVSFNFNIDSEKHFNKEVLCNAFSYLPITNQGTKYVKESFVFLKSLDLAGSVAMEEKDIL